MTGLHQGVLQTELKWLVGYSEMFTILSMPDGTLPSTQLALSLLCLAAAPCEELEELSLRRLLLLDAALGCARNQAQTSALRSKQNVTLKLPTSHCHPSVSLMLLPVKLKRIFTLQTERISGLSMHINCASSVGTL